MLRLAPVFFENGQGAFAFGFVVDAGKGVAGCEWSVVVGWSLEFFRIHGFEFGDPSFDVSACGVVLGGLGPRVLDAEVWCGIGSGSGRPLPAPIVGRDFAIGEVLHEMGFAQFPIDVEVLG